MTITAAKKEARSEMKRADRRSSINILVLGDEAVGKSSLISTFVSRYFSQDVPGIMTRVRLPPDPENSCVTTIIDSQGGDAALISAVAALSLRSGAPSSESLQGLVERAEASLSQTTTNSPTRGAVVPPTAPSPPITADRVGTRAAAASVTSPTRATGFAATSSGMENVDSIVLVYDLDRVETFFRLERHWLPLIQRCYNGKVPVIVAENKMDLFRPSTGMTDEQALARKRQQIVSLMQQFPFVRQCIKCSAKNLLRVDDVFLKAQQAVLYPFTPPLYDLETGRLTVECKRAFTRIFRMYDRDHDSLLSDSELDRFQRETYYVAVFDRDFAAWRKVVTRNNLTDEVVIQDGKFTVAGFLAIFDVFISQNRLDVVWQALRKFGYDDDLNLHIPESITTPIEDEPISEWKLSSSAKKFLVALFHQFDSNQDNSLSPDDIVSMFSILAPPALPPWHPHRAPELFEGCFSMPKASPSRSAGESSSTTTSSGGVGTDPSASLIVPAALSQSLSNSVFSILSANDSLPSIDVGGMHPLTKSLTFLEWMGHWHAVTAISPAVARAELFRLGHVEEGGRRKSRRSRKKQRVPMVLAGGGTGSEENLPYKIPESTLRSRETRVLVLGSQGSGKTALLNALCGSFDGTDLHATDTTPTSRPETSTTFVKLRKMARSTTSSGGGTKVPSSTRSLLDEEGEEIVMHLVFTDVPESAAASQEEYYRELTELFGATTSPKDRVCDLVMLVFDPTSRASWTYTKELETSLLTKETPRVFVATKADLLDSTAPKSKDDDVVDDNSPGSSVLEAAELHCKELDLEAPLLTCANMSEESGGSTEAERHRILDHLARCALSEPGISRLRSRPHEEQKRREAARRTKMMWLGGIVSLGVVVAVGMGLFWRHGSSKKDPKSSSGGSFGWLRSLFGGSMK